MTDTTRHAITRKQAAIRVEAFLDARDRAGEYDPTFVALDSSDDRHRLTTADLRTLIAAVLEES